MNKELKEKYQKDLKYLINEYLSIDLDGYAENVKLLSSKIVKVRKDHRCGISSQSIKKGDYARLDTGIVDDKMATTYTSIKWLDEEMDEHGIYKLNKNFKEIEND